ncbi:MAG: hypothetical protein HZA34_01020 [Candidatus Pacebacteria bacterium]|nr:hypothetical protein [Candidatus Paceibacterota bacterium]
MVITESVTAEALVRMSLTGLIAEYYNNQSPYPRNEITARLQQCNGLNPNLFLQLHAKCNVPQTPILVDMAHFKSGGENAVYYSCSSHHVCSSVFCSASK